MQVLRENSAESTGVFSIFSGMQEMEHVPEPLDLTLGRDIWFVVFEMPSASSQNNETKGVMSQC